MSESAEITNKPRLRRTLVGVVTSDKMQKTVVVTVIRRVRHSMYKKYIRQRVKYKAHDEHSVAKEGDLVLLVETRPLSKEKRWRVQEIIEKAR